MLQKWEKQKTITHHPNQTKDTDLTQFTELPWAAITITHSLFIVSVLRITELPHSCSCYRRNVKEWINVVANEKMLNYWPEEMTVLIESYCQREQHQLSKIFSKFLLNDQFRKWQPCKWMSCYLMLNWMEYLANKLELGQLYHLRSMCINLQKSADSTPKSWALSIEHDASVNSIGE